MIPWINPSFIINGYFFLVLYSVLQFMTALMWLSKGKLQFRSFNQKYINGHFIEYCSNVIPLQEKKNHKNFTCERITMCLLITSHVMMCTFQCMNCYFKCDFFVQDEFLFTLSRAVHELLFSHDAFHKLVKISLNFFSRCDFLTPFIYPHRWKINMWNVN